MPTIILNRQNWSRRRHFSSSRKDKESFPAAEWQSKAPIAGKDLVLQFLRAAFCEPEL